MHARARRRRHDAGGRGDRLDRVGPRPAARAARDLAQARQRGRAPDLLLAAPRPVGQARGDRRPGWPTTSSSRRRRDAAGWPAIAATCTRSCLRRRCATSPAELEGRSFDACVSSNRTCEVALQQVTGRSYESFVLALEAADSRLAEAMPGGSGPPAGLCDTCRHQQLVPNRRGSVFSLCLRSRTEPDRFPRYPRLPVSQCDGYEPTEAAADPGRARCSRPGPE